MRCFTLNLLAFLLTASIAHGQLDQTKDLVPELEKECETIRIVAAQHPPDPEDNYKTAGNLCAELQVPSRSLDAEAQTARDLYQLLARMNLPPSTPADRFAALESSALAKDGLARFYVLVDLAKVAFDAGEVDKASVYAHELLQIAPQYPKDWNYGNAIYYSHFVLGRIAIREGNIKGAADELEAAGATPGSPQLDTFGPNLTLAQDLLAQGQTQPVLAYLAECKLFWKGNGRKVDEWMDEIRSGNAPDFSRNLNY